MGGVGCLAIDKKDDIFLLQKVLFFVLSFGRIGVQMGL